MVGAFGIFRSLKPEDQQYSSVLKAHGERALHTVDDVLKKAGQPDELVTYLHELGSKHVSFSAKAEYMDVRIPHIYLFNGIFPFFNTISQMYR
jgi:hypothetical protein